MIFDSWITSARMPPLLKRLPTFSGCFGRVRSRLRHRLACAQVLTSTTYDSNRQTHRYSSPVSLYHTGTILSGSMGVASPDTPCRATKKLFAGHDSPASAHWQLWTEHQYPVNCGRPAVLASSPVMHRHHGSTLCDRTLRLQQQHMGTVKMQSRYLLACLSGTNSF